MARLQKFIELYRYNTLIEFGEFKSEYNEDDGVIRDGKFVPSFSLYGAMYRLGEHNVYDNQGPNIQETIQYAVRELGKVSLGLQARVNGVIYRVTRISPSDDYTNPRNYDLVFLQRGNGVDRTYRTIGGSE